MVAGVDYPMEVAATTDDLNERLLDIELRLVQINQQLFATQFWIGALVVIQAMGLARALGYF
jgi:hypothetical protein